MIANEMAPPRTSPPMACAAQAAAPSTTAVTGTASRLVIDSTRSVIENLLHRPLEVPCQRDRKRERGRVALGLDRVDRLPGNLHRCAELGLSQASTAPQSGDPVPHRCQVCLTRFGMSSLLVISLRLAGGMDPAVRS